MLCVFIVTPASPSAAQQTTQHVVQHGETLAIIGTRYGVTWSDLAIANGITNPNRSLAGQTLVIPAKSTVTPTNTVNYTIRYGDTLSTIAQKYHTTVDAIVAVNDITAGSRIYPNQVLRVPAQQPPAPPAPQPTPTLIPVPTPLPLPAPIQTHYAVRAGDTMFRIASAFGVNVYDLAEANGILNLNLIYAGQWLAIPRR